MSESDFIRESLARIEKKVDVANEKLTRGAIKMENHHNRIEALEDWKEDAEQEKKEGKKEVSGFWWSVVGGGVVTFFGWLLGLFGNKH